MMYTISTPGRQIVLTLTPDMNINSPNLYQTDELVDRALSSSVSSIIFDLSGLSDLNSIGSWTMFQIVYRAKTQGKDVFLYNMQPAIRAVLVEAGIVELARLIHTKEELDRALEGPVRTSPHSSSIESSQRKDLFSKGHGDSTGVAV